jgi:hypothetical protein
LYAKSKLEKILGIERAIRKIHECPMALLTLSRNCAFKQFNCENILKKYFPSLEQSGSAKELLIKGDSMSPLLCI